MICEEESKHGFNFKEVPQQCHTCLSVSRKLSPLGPNMDILRKIIPQCTYWSTCNMKSVGICWECNSVLVKILEFQNKVLRATEILQLGQAYLYSTLSNLTSVIFNDSSTNVINITETDTDTKLETIDYDIKDDTGHISDEFTQTIEIESFKIELNEVVENNKKVKNNKWAMKKALLNKKPKFKVILDYKDIFRKIKISSEEIRLCLEKERDSEPYKTKKYKCESCVVGFKDENALARHSERYHSQSLGTYICDICHTHKSKKNQIVQHIATHYNKYVCVLCPYSCYHKRHRISHWKTHRKAFQCIKCKLKFGARREFFKHYKEWHEKYICHHCGVSFKMRYCIKDHIRKQHSPFVCKQCDKSFSRYNGLWLHNKDPVSGLRQSVHKEDLYEGPLRPCASAQVQVQMRAVRQEFSAQRGPVPA
ncbi:uncharacterized protein isoform X2 [Choristoneura fumiferana]|uniref:uncharacterized protein isoform X2 n=1 Tax=Choristoneura fumiferana TaxID=7141 RepID=UPI003D15A28E